ncbi:hypothetical protein RNJ44_01420 [Nakaseomyces bracarensis]|uniref:NAD-dependent epimerase/dehydratase domain-containing protein n=1 Tax=Nakaseomyces bracarensis TaxID=273131 RepID=A0ABR4NPM6_9SACH
MQSLIVFGGNGFLGKRICQEAIKQGLKVTSISRSGQPPRYSTAGDLKWIEQVKWASGDVFEPETYKDKLAEADNVVHSMGILLENENYKRSLNGEGFKFNLGSNPLDKHDSSNFTYQRMNKESALILANAFKEVKSNDSRGAFAYISADNWFPLIPEEYITSKREAESQLLRFNEFRPIIVRPGYMFDEYRGIGDKREYMRSALDLLNWTNRTFLNSKIRCVNNIIRPTVSTQQVSRSLISKIMDPNFKGIMYLEDLLKRQKL